MSTNSSNASQFLLKHFLISLFAGLIFFVTAFCFTYFISWFPPRSGPGGAIIGIALFCICAWRSGKSVHILHVFVATAGVIWGGVFSASVASFLHNDEEFGWLPMMIHASLVMPVVTAVMTLPFWYFGKRRHDWNIRGANYCLKIALITPLVLVAAYTVTFSCYWLLSPSRVTMFQGKKVREVSFKTTLPDCWNPGFWFVERVCKYQETGIADGRYYVGYGFMKILDSPNLSPEPSAAGTTGSATPSTPQGGGGSLHARPLITP